MLPPPRTVPSQAAKRGNVVKPETVTRIRKPGKKSQGNPNKSLLICKDTASRSANVPALGIHGAGEKYNSAPPQSNHWVTI